MSGMTRAFTLPRPLLLAAALFALAAIASAVLVPASVHGQDGDSITMTATFGAGDAISDKTYTAGARVNQVFTSAWDQGLPRLPEVTVNFDVEPGAGYYEVEYTATGLPMGLTMARDRVIRGIPVPRTSDPNPVDGFYNYVAYTDTVTYTATVTFYTSDGSSFSNAGTKTASLTFDVTVNPPVTFNKKARKFIDSRILVWNSGKGWDGSESDGKITFPEAEGGTGALTYSLIDSDSGQPLSSVATGVTFDTATRKLGGTPEAAAQKTWAVTYAAVDQNGSRAAGSSTVYAGGWGVGGL